MHSTSISVRRDFARSSLAVFLGLAVVLPFANYYRVNPSPTFYSELAAALFFLAACAAGASLLPRRQAIVATIAPFCLGLLAILALQVLAGYYEFVMSWAAWAAYLCFFFLAVAFGQLAAADGELRSLVVDRLAAAFVLVALMNSFFQVAQVTEWSLQIYPLVFIPGSERYSLYTCAPAGNVAQLNQANAVAWLGIAGLVYAFSLGRVRSAFFVVGLAVLLSSSALTSSRMAWIMAAALSALLVSMRQGMGWSRHRALAVGGLLVLGLLAATLARQLALGGCSSSIDRAVSGFGIGSADHGAGYWIRLEMARQAIMVWLSQPFLGVGVGKFMAGTFALEPSRDTIQPLDFYPHNAVLEVLVSFGVVGAILLVACGTAWFVRAWRMRNASAQQWPLLAGLVVISVPALLETALWYLYFLLPFGLMLGLALGPTREARFALRLPWRWLFPAAALVSLPLLAFAARDHMRAERVVWLSNVAQQSGELGGVAAKRVHEAARELTVFAVWGEHEALRFGHENENDIAAQLAANERLLANILSPHIVARQVMLKILAGQPEEARDLFRRMMVFFPEHYESLAKQLRRRAEAHPNEAGALLAILDEEMARPPQARGGT